jgi:hypothetical protein
LARGHKEPEGAWFTFSRSLVVNLLAPLAKSRVSIVVYLSDVSPFRCIDGYGFVLLRFVSWYGGLNYLKRKLKAGEQ